MAESCAQTGMAWTSHHLAESLRLWGQRAGEPLHSQGEPGLAVSASHQVSWDPPLQLRLQPTLLPIKGPGAQRAPSTACTYSSPFVSSRETCMISCRASRLACPFSSLDHLLELQNGTAHPMSATPASLIAMPVLMPLLMLSLCSSMPHLLLIHCSRLGTMEAKVSGTKKSHSWFRPIL